MSQQQRDGESGRGFASWGLCIGCAAALVGCAAETELAPTHVEPPIEPLPVLALIEGEWDGRELTFRTLEEHEVAELADDGLVSAELVDIPSRSCTSTTCTDANYVAFSNVAGTRVSVTNGVATGTWNTTLCGPAPVSPSSGVCQQVRLRNLYSTQIERAYADLISLTPTGVATSASVPIQPFSATTDFSLAPAIANGLWRFGEIGRSNSVATKQRSRAITGDSMSQT